MEVHLKIELPVTVTNIAGNAEEGSQIINNDEQIYSHHQCQPIIDIADAKYDIKNNYNYLRGKRSIPIIDYNPRNENLSKQALIDRGYDQNRCPFAPCVVFFADLTVLTKNINGLLSVALNSV